MLTGGPEPLQNAREAALRLLARLVLWFWSPVFAYGVWSRWDDVGLRPLLVLVAVGVPVSGLLLRSAKWSAHTRARAAVALFLIMALSTMLANGPRALNTMAVGLSLSLAMLFSGPRAALGIVLVATLTVIASIALNAGGYLPPQRAEADLPVVYRVMSVVVMFTGLWFSARVIFDTIGIYRDAQQASEARYLALLDLQREAEVLQRRELVGTVTTGMTHDLANVLQVMTTTADLLADEPLGPDARQAVRDLRHVGDEATTRLRAVLSIGRAAPSDTPCITHGDELFQRLGLVLEPLVGRRITVRLENALTVPLAIERERLEQVILNLVVNARDAMPTGGTLTVQARDDVGGGRIEVADTGAGIPESVRAHIFEPFYSTKPAGRGTGLGLAMVQRIVEGASGTIDVRSTEGRGTAFTIRLPAAVL